MIKHLAKLLALLVPTVGSATTGEAVAPSDQVVTAIESIVQEIRRNEGYPGISVAVFSEGEPYYVEQRGYADLATETEPDSETMFRAYSITKGITEMMAAILADKGRLDLDAPISDYVTDLPESLQQVTSRQLLTHRSGIRHYTGEQEWLRLSRDHCDAPADAFGRFIDDPLVTEPGSAVHYSSFGYVLLSQVLVEAGGSSFSELLEQNVFAPTGAVRIELDDPATNTIDKVSTYYERQDDSYVEAQPVDNSCKFGAGAINASASVIARIFSAFYSERLISRDSLQALVPSLSTGSQVISFGGEGLGGRSALVAYPHEELVVVILANARGGELTQYGRRIAERVRHARAD